MSIVDAITTNSIELQGSIFGIDKNSFLLAFISAFFSLSMSNKRFRPTKALLQVFFAAIIAAALTPIVYSVSEHFISGRWADFNMNSITEPSEVLIPVLLGGFFQLVYPFIEKFINKKFNKRD